MIDAWDGDKRDNLKPLIKALRTKNIKSEKFGEKVLEFQTHDDVYIVKLLSKSVEITCKKEMDPLLLKVSPKFKIKGNRLIFNYSNKISADQIREMIKYI